MRAAIKQAVLASALCALLLVAAATDKASDLPAGITPDAGLLDSYIQLTKPKVSLSPKQSGREGRTTLTLQLSQQNVGQFMPTSSPEVQGLTFDVLNTWDALKSMAKSYRHAEEANRLSASGTPPVFPKTSLAARSAAVATPPPEASTAAAAASTAAPRRNPFVSFPPNLMMVPFGSSTAAIADVLDVAYDEGASAITLQLDVVHDPVVFSQFIPNHTPHSVDTKAAHYHFATRPGMAVDAPGLLKGLKESNYSPAGLHVFLKSEPLQSCYVVTVAPDAATIAVGSSVDGVVTLSDSCKRASEVADGFYVDLALTGRGDFTALSSNPNTKASKSPSRRKQPGHRQEDTTMAQAWVTNGRATFTVEATGEGTITVEVTGYGKTTLNPPLPTLTITVGPEGPVVSTVLLKPAKAYRHCGDALTLTAYAFDSTGAHVPDANITFAAFGECNPSLSATSALTNAEGAATVTLDAHQHGAVAVVAAVAVDGGVVTSKPAHVFFFDDHISYTDERERDYYAAGPGGSGGEHYRYEREAAKLAQQHALGAPVSTSN